MDIKKITAFTMQLALNEKARMLEKVGVKVVKFEDEVMRKHLSGELSSGDVEVDKVEVIKLDEVEL